MNDLNTQLDVEKIKEDAKNEAIKAAQDALISKLQGDKPRFSWEEKGKQAPSDYDELFNEVDKRIPKIDPSEIDKRVEEKLKEKEELRLQQEEKTRKEQVKSLEESKKAFDKEWYELVQDKKMPSPAPEIQERINKGEKLSREEIMNDEGLKARLELAQLAQNKSAKLAYYEDYQNKQPAGANAPVLGGRTRVQSESTELNYEEVSQNRKKLFGF